MEWSHQGQLFRSRGTTCSGHTGAHSPRPGDQPEDTGDQAGSCVSGVRRESLQQRRKPALTRSPKPPPGSTPPPRPQPGHIPPVTPELMSLHMVLYAPHTQPCICPMCVPLSSFLPCPACTSASVLARKVQVCGHCSQRGFGEISFYTGQMTGPITT